MIDNGYIPYSYETDARLNPRNMESSYFREKLAEERARNEERARQEREAQEHAYREMDAAMGPDYDEEGFGTYI